MSRRQKSLALTRIEGNLVYTSTEVWAWYLLPPQRWMFRADADRIALYESIIARLAQLSGRHIHLRVTSQPYPAREWAAQIHADTPHPVSAEQWRRYLLDTQARLDVAVTAEKRTYLGVRLAQRGLKAGKAPGPREAAAAAKEEKILADVISSQGLEGDPATTSELEWLMHRSIGLTLPPPPHLSAVTDQPWEAGDLYQLIDNVELDPHPFGATTTVARTVGTEQTKREVAVLTLGRIGPRHGVDSSVLPWLTLPDTLPFPVEISVRMQLLTGEQTRGKVNRKLQGIRDQQKSYRNVGMDEPNALEEQAALAKEIEDQMARGLPTMANSAFGHIRFAVPGYDTEQAMENVRTLRDLYGTLQMDLVHASGTWSGAQQVDLLREFIPGESAAGKFGTSLVQSAAYVRRVPIRYIAAGVPQVSAQIGDSRGPYIGFTVGGARRAVHFDPHYSTEETDQTGLVPIIGTLGSGKSVLKGSIVYANVLRGSGCISFDPSGPFARLTKLPELAPVSRAINLLDDAPGTLNPFAVVGEPNPENYPDPVLLERARADGRRRRKMLALDVMTMLLPPQLAADPSTESQLVEALDHFQGVSSTDLHSVVNKLDRDDPNGKRLWTILNQAAEMPMANLFFNTGGLGGAADLDSYKFLVLTMPGLSLPSREIPREEWSIEERLSMPLMHMAAWYTSRLIYSRPMKERKMASFDEGHFLSGWGAGRRLFNRLGRDNRKWNLSVLFASQTPQDILGMKVSDFVGTAFIGRVEDSEAQREALRLLRLQPGIGHEAMLGSLSSRRAGRINYREFVMRDARDNVDRVSIDLDHIPHVLAALDTSVNQVNQLVPERAA